MTPRTINTKQQTVACDVCGRTLLRGEHADVYLAGGRRHQVCDLCTPRAAHEGWIREGAADRFDHHHGGSENRRSLLGRLRARRERAAREVELPPLEEGRLEGLHDAADEPHAPALDQAAAFDAVGAPMPPGWSEPAATPHIVAPPATHEHDATASPEALSVPRHVRAVPSSSRQKMVRALEIFNRSEHPRTVAGIARSLGAPTVAVRPSATQTSVVTIVVAWELSWYRYGVDLSDERGGVEVLTRGHELDELPAEDREENAFADERGALSLA